MIDGYKESPLGKIPKNWEIVSVKEITKEHKQGFYTKDSYTNDGIRLARITDLNNPKVVFSEMPMLNISDSDYQNYKIEKGDFLFARSGAIGRYGIVEDEEYPAVFASYLIRFRFNNNIVNRYFGYFFESYLCNNQLRGITQGNANVNINAENIKSLKFPLAPFGEQQKIAEILITVDDKIEVIDQQITETQELKKGLMQRLLTKGIGHTEFKDSPLGMIPESWEVVKLSDVCHKIGDGIHSTPKYVDNSEYYFVNGNNLINGTLTVSEKTKCVSKDEYEKLRIHLNLNSILMSINGTIGNLALYKNEEVVFGKSASYISAKEDRLHYLFLYYYLQHSNTKKYFYDELTGSTIKNLSLKTIRNTPTILPSKTEQEKIANTLSLVDEKLKVLLEKKAHYQELKQGLMQQLLTGKIRVKV
ncbi:restriction endonuclease subunit S [Chryseobacterium sp. KCF3-3]|uniref:restriction endonuclease subunit S n=1 Tax=Chryseobacterium sp. KCF3-3 TaxID=3231511 RepID=UPI0038B3F1FC